MDKEISVTMDLIKNFPFLQVLGISFLFGIVSWIQKVKNNPLKKNLFDFSTEIVMSIAGGFLASKVCESIKLDSNFTIVCICVASYSGVKFIEFMNFAIMSKIGKETGLDADKVNEQLNKLNQEDQKKNEELVRAKED